MAATLPASPFPVSDQTTPHSRPPERRRVSPWADSLFALLAHGAAWLTLLLLVAIIVSLLIGAAPAIQHFGLGFLWSSDWDPVKEKFGGLVMIYGTLMTSFIALLIAVPVSFGIAIFLTEMSPGWLKRPLGIAIELLAAVPSIVYGILGLAIFINFAGLPQSASIVGGLVLTLMTLPRIIIPTRAALKAVPPSIRDAALGVGASKLQTVTHHVLPLAMPGILTGTIIGLAQALGETAPLLLIGMVAFVRDFPGAPPMGLFDPASALGVGGSSPVVLPPGPAFAAGEALPLTVKVWSGESGSLDFTVIVAFAAPSFVGW